MVRQMELRGQKPSRAGSYEFAPGEEMQHDTSPHTVIMAGKRIKTQCASLVMGYCKKILSSTTRALRDLRPKCF
jgi:hypothetical protein